MQKLLFPCYLSLITIANYLNALEKFCLYFDFAQRLLVTNEVFVAFEKT